MHNKVHLIGHLGRDPDDRIGNQPLRFSVATSERWKDKTNGESRERTEWHQVVVFNAKLIEVAEGILKKGSKVWIEGRIGTRSFEGRDGAKRYVTEIVLDGPQARIVFLDRRSGERAPEPGSVDDYGCERDDLEERAFA